MYTFCQLKLFSRNRIKSSYDNLFSSLLYFVSNEYIVIDGRSKVHNQVSIDRVR